MVFVESQEVRQRTPTSTAKRNDFFMGNFLPLQ
jgi:hypothetical protein